MKSARLTTVLLIGLAVMCNGCSALMPPTDDNLRAQIEYQQIKASSSQTDTSQSDSLWSVLYDELSSVGESLANDGRF
jgi:hypothetical protein